MSDVWTPASGLRKGCSTSPTLLNMYHQAVMRQAEEVRGEQGAEVGVCWRRLLSESFAVWKVWEKGVGEGKIVKMACALFADNTTRVGMRDETDYGIRAVKSVMDKWEELNNDTKEEVIEFGTNEAGSVRVLGRWVSAEADVNNRIKRANGLWWKVRT